MNKNLLCFGGGLATGFGLAYVFLKNRFDDLLDQESDKIKEYYEECLNEHENELVDEAVGNLDEEVKEPKKGENEPNKGTVEPNYSEIINKLNYNEFSTKPKKEEPKIDEESKVDHDSPYIIDYEDFANNHAYEKSLISYFMDDEILMYADSDELMDDPGKFLGWDNLADLRDNDELEEIYIRNEYMGIDFHVFRENGSYDDYLAE